jgi:hypothetical protein
VRKFLALAGISLAAIVPSAPSAAQIADGSFETQAPNEIGATNPGYCYGNGGGGGAFECSNGNSPWFAASGGGYQLETNSAWPGSDTPAGMYYAFIQGGGSVNQQFTADATGTFTLDFLAAGRNSSEPNSGNQMFEVLLDGATIFSGSTTAGQPFTAMTTDPFDLIMGNLYSLSFHGLSFTADETAYIDDVRLTSAAVPEPATWAMMLIGLGAVGVAFRRRTQPKSIVPKAA